ncbi:MAG: metallophosphoesterase, partial [Actinobacteria bacterium]|nr:metallophosphoesterase [Actinomycetota bacterium]
MTYRLREVQLSILPKGSPTIRVLHFSDLHLTPSREREISIIRCWVDLKPDLVISTGDFLGHQSAIDIALYALEPLLSIPGLYVFGSNDYYGPRFKNPLSYLRRHNSTRKLGPRLNIELFDESLKSRGWKNLNTSKVEFSIQGVLI